MESGQSHVTGYGLNSTDPPPAYGYNRIEPVTQQPPPIQHTQSNTTVVINQQNPVRPLGRDWNTGMLGCFSDLPSCIGVLLCGGCCYPCYLSDKLGESFCLPICLPGTTWLLALRVKMRAQNNIRGSIIDDNTAACMCHPCVMCQLSREHDFIMRQ
ncbi:cornifelin-like [Saccostrea cucullata]|uniref:cornifelin-like n=1 Tax=Saccostrea cuccullata TaxID=36930 RepID=UPI002ED33647